MASPSAGSSAPQRKPVWLEMVRQGRSPERPWFKFLCAFSTLAGIFILAVLLFSVTANAFSPNDKGVGLDWQFLSSFDSSRPAKAGLLAALLGTGWVVTLTMLLSVPIGIGAAIYLEEYATDNLLTRIIRINLTNLAGVPSIVYGILGLTAFVYMFNVFKDDGIWWIDSRKEYLIPLPFGRSVISGALTLTLLILPVIIVASQEALRAVPPSLRHASLALGATRWQTIWNQTLPAALPSMLTGIILALSRAIGETAPLLMVGAVGYINYAPGRLASLKDLAGNPSRVLEAPFDSFIVIPVQIYTWVDEAHGNPANLFNNLAAAGIVVLLILLLLLNGIATYIRYRFEKHNRW